jgi:hypothetical protein
MEFAGLPWDFRTQDRGHAGSALHHSVTALSVKKTLTVSGGTLAFLILPRENLRARHKAGLSSRSPCRDGFDKSAHPHRGQCQIQNRTGNIYLQVPAVLTFANEYATTECECWNRDTGEWLPPSFRSRDTEWTHRHAFKVPDGDAGRTHCAKMQSSRGRFGCTECVIKG